MESKRLESSFSIPTISPSTRWWSKDTVAIVTGANKGIGYAMVRRLAVVGVTVILTARDNVRGLKAIETLKETGLLHVHFFCLDVSDPDSIKLFGSWFAEKFGKLDILVNNAAVVFNDMNSNSVEHADEVMKTNFYGPKLLIETLLPMFRRSSTTTRILNLSSRLGLLNKVRNPHLKATLLNVEQLSVEKIEAMVKSFLEDVKSGTWKTKGWPEYWTDYAVSKLALNAYSQVLARQYEGRGISINCFCPGHTQTSMTQGTGHYTAEAAADVAIKLTLLQAEQLPSGKFFLRSSRGLFSNAYSKL